MEVPDNAKEDQLFFGNSRNINVDTAEIQPITVIRLKESSKLRSGLWVNLSRISSNYLNVLYQKNLLPAITLYIGETDEMSPEQEEAAEEFLETLEA